jgi:hypothetical protein
MASNLTAHRRVLFLELPSLAEYSGNDMYGINMQAARWKVNLALLAIRPPALQYSVPGLDPSSPVSPEGRSPVFLQRCDQ